MADIANIFAIIKISLFGLSILLALIYSLPILIVRRFHHRLNMLTVNICVSIVLSSTYWMGYFIMYQYYINYLYTEITCTFLFYIQTINSCNVPFTFAVLTFNRFCAIVYPGKAFFKTKKFVIICVASQWLVVCLVSLPFKLAIKPYCNLPQWMGFYTVIIVVIVPALITLILNLGIFKHAHSSSRRIKPQNESTVANVTMEQQPRIKRRDIYLLRHTAFMFFVFVIGWSPIFLLVAIDYSGSVDRLVYTLLQVLAVLSTLACMLNLFFYNREVTRYIKDKLFKCF